MRVLVIETFRNGDPKPVYKRFAERGRSLPDGVTYVDSWVAEDGARCFQLMDCDDAAQLQPWIAGWADLADFEVIPVIDSATAVRRFGDASL